MGLQQGDALVLRIGDGGTPEGFLAVGGLIARSLALTAQSIDGSHVGSAGWRDLVSGAGPSSARISGSGAFVGDAAAKEVQAVFFGAEVRRWQIDLPGLGVMEGAFQVLRLEFAGPYAGEMRMSLALASTGVLTFTEEN